MVSPAGFENEQGFYYWPQPRFAWQLSPLIYVVVDPKVENDFFSGIEANTPFA